MLEDLNGSVLNWQRYSETKDHEFVFRAINMCLFVKMVIGLQMSCFCTCFFLLAQPNRVWIVRNGTRRILSKLALYLINIPSSLVKVHHLFLGVTNYLIPT